MMTKTDICWMIGGPQGSGVDSSATLFARACAVAGYWVFGKREYHSNIKGEHSYYQVRVKTEPVGSIVDPISLLATFEDSTARIHAHEIMPNGALIYDPKATKPETLELAEGVLLFPVAYDELIQKLAEETGQNVVKLAIMKNTISVAASMALYGVELKAIEGALEGLFSGKKAKLIPLNLKAAELAYEAISQNPQLAQFPFKLVKPENPPANGSRLIINGAAATALGKLKAGCRFVTYYSITPAVDECIYLEDHSSDFGAVVIQCEDELAAVNMVNGAALTGTRASTATSGPGFSLMAEGIGWAGINEVPTVVFNYQRGGPSTGLPTRNEQGDLLFALHTGHGDYPKIVLAPGDMQECFEDGFYSFNYAERYQTPVIVLPDKALANSTITVPHFDETGMVVDRGEVVPPSPDYKPGDASPENMAQGIKKFERFAITENGVSPRPLPGMPGRIYWMTGDEHDVYGNITEEPAIRLPMHEKRMKKLDLALAEIPVDRQYKIFGPEQADISLVSWGSNKLAILDAMKVLEQQGVKVNFMHIRLFSPFPVDAVTNFIQRGKVVVDVESNYSAQLAQLIRMRTGIDIEHKILKWTGRPISETEMVEAVQEILQKQSRKVVLTRGR
jgi:2-oxoglutarate ferredoxin oxidoreductase subunit alpha